MRNNATGVAARLSTRGARRPAPGNALSESRRMVSSIHVLGSHELGGADWFFVRLVEALQRAGHPTLAVIRANSPVREVLPPTARAASCAAA